MKYKNVIIFALLASLIGCSVDGDDGSPGIQGPDGSPGIQGPQGSSGVSCWDLNEDGDKTMPDEDTNSDGVIDVYDCRTATNLSPTTTIIDTSTQTITNQHSREVYSSALAEIMLFTGSIDEYKSASDDWSVLDTLVAMPIEDPCGLWKWTETSPGSGTYNLQAENSVAYDVRHMLAIAFYSSDPSEDAHFGYEQCQHACQSDSDCVGAFYAAEEGTDNSLNCKLLRDVGFEIDRATEFEALTTGEIGFTSANIQYSPIYIGVLSVCNAP